MRVYRYVDASRRGLQPRVAIAPRDGEPVDVVDAWTRASGGFDGDVGPALTSTLQLIEAGPEMWAAVEDAAGAVQGDEDLTIPEDARLLCPLDRLSSLRDFLAFESHVKLGAMRRNRSVPEYWYEAPVYYKGNHRSIIGPGDVCPWPRYTERLDFELELAMVVGRGGRDVARDDAHEHVFGFTIMNDFSARDIQAREMSAWLGPAKGKDFATALGPCIVTADEIGAEPDLEMACSVNGEERGRARSSEMHWSWADMIAHVSQDEDIYPGDVYGSGTPGGCCGLDQGRFIGWNDLVDLEVDVVGLLCNVVGADE
ncbi:MAG TPA: fumarylacetoacetate hydrolase family protein [Actinomycetota bacterium]|nr:fumarylacetoacetate hydrolase family protein [Actinomycetota bacterium]